MPRWVKRLGLAGVAMLLACQFVTVDRGNPPVDPSKDLYATGTVPADVRAILRRSCDDCHSNETRWPWYSYVAPVSWLVAFDVREGREDLSFSKWGSYSDETKEQKLRAICRRVRQGEMPDGKYTLIHRGAHLSDADRQALCRWTDQARKALATPGAASSR
jgi:Haem-binding domain